MPSIGDQYGLLPSAMHSPPNSLKTLEPLGL